MARRMASFCPAINSHYPVCYERHLWSFSGIQMPHNWIRSSAPFLTFFSFDLFCLGYSFLFFSFLKGGGYWCDYLILLWWILFHLFICDSFQIYRARGVESADLPEIHLSLSFLSQNRSQVCRVGGWVEGVEGEREGQIIISGEFIQSIYRRNKCDYINWGEGGGVGAGGGWVGGGRRQWLNSKIGEANVSFGSWYFRLILSERNWGMQLTRGNELRDATIHLLSSSASFYSSSSSPSGCCSRCRCSWCSRCSRCCCCCCCCCCCWFFLWLIDLFTVLIQKNVPVAMNPFILDILLSSDVNRFFISPSQSYPQDCDSNTRHQIKNPPPSPHLPSPPHLPLPPKEEKKKKKKRRKKHKNRNNKKWNINDESKSTKEIWEFIFGGDENRVTLRHRY